MSRFSSYFVLSTFAVLFIYLGGISTATAEGDRIGLLKLDDTQESGKAVDIVEDKLTESGYEVARKEKLRVELTKFRLKAPSNRIVSEFSGLSNKISKGVKNFFYRGNDQAINRLEPPYRLGINNPQMLTFRPDYADQIYEAGVILIRAYRNTDNPKKAEAIALELASYFPTSDVGRESTPPSVRKLIRKKKKTIRRTQSRVDVRIPSRQSCTLYVNGIEAATHTFAVSSNRRYMLRVDCIDQASSIWELPNVPRGTTRRVSLVSGDPLSIHLDRITHHSRQQVSGRFSVLCDWLTMNEFVGVKSDPSGNVRAVRHRCGNGSRWSSATPVRSLSGAVARLYGQETEGNSIRLQQNPERFDKTAWGLIGGGTFVSGLGVFAVLSAKNRLKQINCSPTLGNSSRDECSDVDRIAFDNQNTANDARNRAKRVRGLGYVGIGLGVVGAGWGIWRLMAPPGKQLESAWKVRLSPKRVTVEFSF